MPSVSRNWSIGIIIFIVSSVIIPVVTGLGCFRCASFQGSNPRCHDTFNDSIKDYYEENCFALLASHDDGTSSEHYLKGDYPASYCIKIYAPNDTNDRSKDTYIRECVTKDIGTFNYGIQLSGQTYSGGFVKTCKEDGCNGVHLNVANPELIISTLALVSVLWCAWCAGSR